MYPKHAKKYNLRPIRPKQKFIVLRLAFVNVQDTFCIPILLSYMYLSLWRDYVPLLLYFFLF